MKTKSPAHKHAGLLKTQLQTKTYTRVTTSDIQTLDNLFVQGYYKNQ
jgi:hypothetical protein